VADGIVPICTFISGYERAAQRFYDVMNNGAPAQTFIPLFEALGWAYSIDDRFQAAWEREDHADKLWYDGFKHGDVVKGFRFARNRVHHQWAEALHTTSGASLPRALPFALMEWRWNSELPPGWNDRFKSEYEDRLADSPVRVTLGELQECFLDAAGQGLG
jgi:hypothetical protein